MYKHDVVAQALAEEHGEAGLIWLDGDASELGRWLHPRDPSPLHRHIGRTENQTHPAFGQRAALNRDH